MAERSRPDKESRSFLDEQGFEIQVKSAQRDLDEARSLLSSWLAPRLGRDVSLSPIQMPSGAGVANETLLFDAEWTDGSSRRSAGFVARVAADAPLFVDADLLTHYQMYEMLMSEPDVPSPAVVAYESDPSLLGRPFFVMEKVDGLVPSDNPPYNEAGFVFEATPAERERLWRGSVEVLARFHGIDAAKASFLQHPEAGASGLEQDLAYWRRYCDWATAGQEHAVLETGWEWLVANPPTHLPTGLGWGDARIANIIYRDFEPVAILDWDTVNLGGGEADLAWWVCLDHGAAGRPRLDGFGTYDDLVDLWQELTGRRADDLHYYLMLSLFRLGAILIRLNQLMIDAGQLPAGTDIGTNSGQMQQLAMLLGITPPGPVTATLPPLRIL
jgi:aminoglycoside phosphotransferase (APT) family kinase protein